MKMFSSRRIQDGDIDVIHEQLEEEYGAATFEAFINLLVSKRPY